MFSSFGTRNAQSAAPLFGNSNANSLTTSRTAIETTNDDPLQPLRTMADRVGKEVEEFAMRVDQWHSASAESDEERYQSTLRMVGKFQQLAESTVDELRDINQAENRGELQKSVRRRIKNMAEEKDSEGYGDVSRSIQSVIPSIESVNAPPSARVQELRQWEAEAATWDLLHVLIEHYHPGPGTDVAADKEALLAEIGTPNRYSHNEDIWDRFLLQDDKAKEKEIVLRWLERTAQNSGSDVDSITQQLENESGKGVHTWTSGWLDTRTRLKQLKRQTGRDQPLGADHTGLRTKDNTQELVTQMDPDAPARQKRALEKPDEYYERALWMVCYEMLRRGFSWKEISDWCKDRGEGWRGISLGVVDHGRPDGMPNLSGPTVGFLFRRTCFYAAKGARTQYESAVYGLLSGDLKEVEPVCRSWDDHLYARYNALLLSRFDSYLMKHYPTRLSQTLAQKFVFQDEATKMGGWESASAQVIDILKQQKTTSAMSLSPIKLIQGGIISKTMQQLICQAGVAVASIFGRGNPTTDLVMGSKYKQDSETKNVTFFSKENATPEKHHQDLVTDANGLRTLVHIFIVLRKGLGLFNIDDNSQREAMDNVIIAYIELLRLTKRIELIPLYAAQLEDDRRYHCLARILPDIRNAQEQRTFIGLMRQYNVDPVRVIKDNYVLTLEAFEKDPTNQRIEEYEILEPTSETDYLWPGQRVKASVSGLKVEPSDIALLESLKWHAHLEKEVYNAFDIPHSALMKFMMYGRIGAAIQLVTDMGVEQLSLIKTEALCGYAFNFMVPGTEHQDESLARSLRRQSHRPSNLPGPTEHANTVYNLREASAVYFDLQQVVRLIDLFREWREEEENIVKLKSSGTTKPSMKRIKDLYDTLTATLEPLLDAFVDDLDDSPGSDAHAVKCVFLPELIIAYIACVQAYAFFTSRDAVTKAMDIATLIAADDREWLQHVFLETGRMSELVDTLALVSRAMLKLGEGNKGVGVKKRESKGETLRVWDLNVRN